MDERMEQVQPVGSRGEWTVRMTWGEHDRNGPTRLEITPTDPNYIPPEGLSHTVLRAINFGSALGSARQARTSISVDPPIDWGTIGDELDAASADEITDLYLAMLSQAYVEASAKSKPVQRLAEVTGKSADTIKSRLRKASQRGFLERSPGRAGGTLTSAAAVVLLGSKKPDEVTIEISPKKS